MPSSNFIDVTPSLVQGISKQSPSIRLPGQVEDASNVSFNVVDGARKRPGTRPLTTINVNGQYGSYRIHKIERDGDEELALIYGSGGVVAMININTGSQVSVAGQPGYVSYQANVDTLRFATIADSTFVANTGITPEATTPRGETINSDTMPVLLKKDELTGGFVWSTPEWAGRSLTRQILEAKNTGSGESGWWKLTYGSSGQNGVQSTSAPLPSSSSSEWIANALQGNGINPNDLLKEIIYMSSSQTSITIEGLTNTTSASEQIRTGRYECLDPLYKDWQGPHPNNPFPKNVAGKAVVGIAAFPYGKVIVTGGPSDTDDVLVQLSPDIDVKQRLICSKGKLVHIGDNATDPPPPFVMQTQNQGVNVKGIPIRDIGFIRNRLVIAAGETLAFSAVDDSFRFYLQEPPVQTDADPINVQLAASDVCLVDFLVPFRKSIIVLTGSGQQFELNGGDVLTPSSVAVSPATKYETQNVRPVAIGNRLYMVGSSAGYSTLLEYYYSEASLSNVAQNVGRHVDDLVPTGVYSLDASPNQESVFMVPTLTGLATPRDISAATSGSALEWNSSASWVGAVIPNTEDNVTIGSGASIIIAAASANVGPDTGDSNVSSVTGSKVVVYRSYTEGNQRKQSAWSQWNFDTDAIQDVKTYDDTQIIMRKSGSKLIIESLDLSEPSGPCVRNGVTFAYTPHLDHETNAGTGTDAGSGNTVFTHTPASGYSHSSYDTLIISNGSSTLEYQKSDVLSEGTYTLSGNELTISGNKIGYKAIIGRRVKSSITLTRPFAKDRAGLPMTDGRTTLRKVVVQHHQSSKYDIEVTSDDANISGRERKEVFTPTEDTETGIHHAWSQGDVEKTSVKLNSDTGGPCTWTSVEQHGTYYSELRNQ